MICDDRGVEQARAVGVQVPHDVALADDAVHAPPSSLTTTAPMRCSERRASSSVTEASVRTVMTSPPLRLTTSEILMHRR